MQKIKFDCGEKRHIKLLIHAADNAPFRIKSVSWSLSYAGEELNSGDGEIIDHIIDVYVEVPEKKASYLLVVTYQINDETLVEQLELVVI